MRNKLNALLVALTMFASVNVLAEGLDSNLSTSTPSLDLSSKLGEDREQLTIANITLEGNKNIDISKELEDSGIKVGSVFDINKLAEAVKKIGATGYFTSINPKIAKSLDGKSVNILLEIKENPVIKSIKIEGNTLFSTAQLLEISGLQVGKILNIYSINPNTSPIMEIYKKNGLIAPNMVPTVDNDGNVNIQIYEGEITGIEYKKTVTKKDDERFRESQYRIKTQDYVLKRNTVVKVGSLLTVDGIKRTLQNLFRTGLFSSVSPDFKQDPNNPNGRIVTFVLEERPTTSINAQFNYEAVEGFTGGLSLKDDNFMGRQQQASIGTNFGLNGNYDFSLNFFDPWIKDTSNLQIGTNLLFKKTVASKDDLDKDEKIDDLNVTLSKYYANLDEDKDTYQYSGSVTLGKGFRGNDVYLTVKPKIYGTYSYSKSDLKTNDYTALGLDLTALYDTRNDPVLPVTGMYASVSADLNYIFRDKSINSDAMTKIARDPAVAILYNDYQQAVQTVINNARSKDYEPLVIQIGDKAKSVKKAYDDYITEISSIQETNSEEQKKNNLEILSNVFTDLKEKNTALIEQINKITKESDNDSEEVKKAKKSLLDAINKEYSTQQNSNLNENQKESLKSEITKLYNIAGYKNKPRFFTVINGDLRFYHKVYEDKNTMAYRFTTSYASPDTPNGKLPTINFDNLALRGYQPQATNFAITATAENRTNINKYLQVVGFAELGINAEKANSHSVKDKDGKITNISLPPQNTKLDQRFESIANMFKDKYAYKADLGVGARITTPIGLIRLDYAWPLGALDLRDLKTGKRNNQDANGNKRSGRFSFGIGQSF